MDPAFLPFYLNLLNCLIDFFVVKVKGLHYTILIKFEETRKLKTEDRSTKENRYVTGI